MHYTNYLSIYLIIYILHALLLFFLKEIHTMYPVLHYSEVCISIILRTTAENLSTPSVGYGTRLYFSGVL